MINKLAAQAASFLWALVLKLADALGVDSVFYSAGDL